MCRTLRYDSAFATSCFIFGSNVLRISVWRLKFSRLSHFPPLRCRYDFTVRVLSGYVPIFVSTYQDHLITIITLEAFGALMASSTRQSKLYPVCTSGSATISEEIMLKEVVFRGVTLCSWVRSFRRFGGA